jgi:excisionase family DNA binding protein
LRRNRRNDAGFSFIRNVGTPPLYSPNSPKDDKTDEAAVTAQPLLTTRQVAELLGLSPATVLRRWRAGELPGYRIASNVLRFNEAEVVAWLEARHLHHDGSRVALDPGPSGRN